MSLHLGRLRSGEWLTAAGAAAMIVALFGLPWYGGSAGANVATSLSRNGWHSFTHMRWLVVVAIVLALALVLAQAAFRAPAIPACLDTVSTVVALAAVLWLVVGVVILIPHHQEAGAWVELAGACAVLAGSFLALRQEGIAPGDGPSHIPVVELNAAGRA
jgi:anaerobic C4-dicarboxylate transporter